ncbi:MAG: L,D-transpeptidase family protein [Sphingomonadaceae bacterium]
MARLTSRRSPPRPLAAAAPSLAALIFAAVLALLIPPPPLIIVAPPPQPVAAARPAAALQQAAYPLRSALPIAGPLVHGSWHWDESKAPATGPMLVTIDIGAQTLSVFRDGHEIGVSTIIYGADHKPTPLGRFPILLKKRDHWSNIYADAPMPFTLRLTGDGIAVHGTDDVRPDLATNGCVGLPIAFAAKLFDAVNVGDIVIVTQNARTKIGDSIPLV